MFKSFFLLSLALFLLAACKFNPDIQGQGETFLQGEWEEDSVLYRDKLLEYTKYRFTFTCDSFYAVLETHAKVDRYPQGCFNNGRWAEYAKGRYMMEQDTLYLIGTFTTADYSKEKIGGCYRIGRYIPKFLVKRSKENEIILVDMEQHRLQRKKEITCVPKPL